MIIRETIKSLVAINAIVNFIGDLFSDPVGTAKGMWEWILDMPRRVGNWFKGMIPEKVRKKQ